MGREWLGKPYYSLDAYCKITFGEKLYKIALDAGLTCPNRDGTLGSSGCIFCSNGGSGDFARHLLSERSFHDAWISGKRALSGKGTGQRFIAYFQAFTNTYGPLPYLERIYRLALSEPDCAGISIATRPDCLPCEVLELLKRLRAEYSPKFIWIELGLQTACAQTAELIGRGYPLSVFEETMGRLKEASFPVILHLILGLPGETREDMLGTVSYVNGLHPFGVKLQLLHVLSGTELGRLYVSDPESYCPFPTLDSYLDTLIFCMERLCPDIVIHRLTGDAPKSLLLSPIWSANKRNVLNTLHKQMKERSSYQGKYN